MVVVAVPALPRLCLVENLGNHQLPIFLLLVVAKVVLVHDPVGLLGLPLLPIVGVEHEDLLEALELSFPKHRPRLASLVPPRLTPGLVIVVGVDLPPFAVASGVCFGGPVEEVPDLPIFAHSCVI